MREFFDVVSHTFLSETEVLEEFIKLAQEYPEEYGSMTFGQYLDNCLNGTLQEI